MAGKRGRLRVCPLVKVWECLVVSEGLEIVIRNQNQEKNFIFL
jgi:hypothetical protein